MTIKDASIGLSLIGGFMGVLFAFVLNGMRYYIIQYFPPLFAIHFFIGGVSLIIIFGTLIEIKRLRAGSLICLISGILLVIYMIINHMSIYYLLRFFTGRIWLISCVALGIWIAILLIGGIVGFIESLRESRWIHITKKKCIDCGAEISPGYDICLSCGSKFAYQIDRSEEKRQMIIKQKKENQRLRKKELRKWNKESLICLFSGILLLIFSIIITQFYNFFGGIISVWVGGVALGIWVVKLLIDGIVGFFKNIKENIKENIEEEIHFEIKFLGNFILLSIATGIFGFFVGLMYNNNGVFGFLVGFLTPLVVLFLLWLVWDALS